MALRNKKLVVLLILISFSKIGYGENLKIKIYFDKNWLVCQPEKATFYRVSEWDTEKNMYVGEFSDFTISDIKICKGAYDEGKKNGIFNFYDETGLLKTSAVFKDDQPTDQWCWYFPNNQIHFKIKFSQDDFEIVSLNDDNGNSILETPSEFVFEFQNDSSHANMEIRGTLKNRKRDGVWSILLDGKAIATDTYRAGKYLRSTDVNRNPQTTNQRILNNLLFVPYSIFACEELNLNQGISEIEYPFLSYRFPWQPIEIAVGLIGDSTLFQIDKKPQYIGGIEAFYRTIAENIILTSNAVHNAQNWGWLYYELTIDENGIVIDKKIIKSPDNLFNDLAFSALNYLGEFRPAYHNGHAIKSKISSRIQFAKIQR
jgi:hypothetical protein